MQLCNGRGSKNTIECEMLKCIAGYLIVSLVGKDERCDEECIFIKELVYLQIELLQVTQHHYRA